MTIKANKPTQEDLRAFVDREVYYCASQLISELAKNEKYSDELFPVLVQDDFESAASDAGWEQFTDEFGVNCFRDKTDGSTWACKTWQELCEAQNIEPYQREAYEHWIVSDYLADKLEEHGEMVLRDFMGLTIWGRCTTGQAILLDGVIETIYKEMMNA